MKRPSLALLALLASLAMGLAAVGPQRAEATTPGVRLCAIEIVFPPCDEVDDSYCPDCPYADECVDECPRVCTPPSLPVEAVEEEVEPSHAAGPEIELNAAATTDATDSESAWEDEYGRYYGDFYSAEEDEYSGEYADEYEAPPAEYVVEELAAPEVVEEQQAEEPDFRYGDGYNPWAPVIEEAATVPGPTDLVVEPSDDAAVSTAVEPYDLYGRQVGDEYYGYDYDEEPSIEDRECESGTEYEYEYDYEAVDESAAIPTSPADEVATEADTSDDSYYEEYYPDYYAELYGSEATGETEGCEESRDLTTDYDAAYDEAVYGENAGEDVPADANIDELVDPTTPITDAENDLPWADEVPAVGRCDEETNDVVERPALESEYGSDYAEDYYRALFGEEAEEEVIDNADAEEVESTEVLDEEMYDFLYDPCQNGHCAGPRGFDVRQMVVDCGRQVFALTESLEMVSMRLHSACVQLASLPHKIETK